MDVSRSFHPQPCEMLVTHAAIVVDPGLALATARRDRSISRTGPLIATPYTRVSIAHREHGTLSTGLSDRSGMGSVFTSTGGKRELAKRLQSLLIREPGQGLCAYEAMALRRIAWYDVARATRP